MGAPRGRLGEMSKVSTAIVRAAVIGVAATAVVMVLRSSGAPPARPPHLVDFWADFDHIGQTTIGDQPPPDAPPPYARTTWGTHQVIVSNTRAVDVPTCFYWVGVVHPHDTVSGLPLFNPQIGSGAAAAPKLRALFQIGVMRTGSLGDALYRHDLALGETTLPVRISLDPYLGQQVAVQFCTALSGTIPPQLPAQFLGWAEPKIAQAPATP